MRLITSLTSHYDRLVAMLVRLEFIPQLLARASVGWVMAQSGWGKLHNLEKTIEFFRSLGIPAANLQAPFAAGTELVCGALLIVGLFTRLAAIPLVAVMIVAIATAKRDDLHSLGDLVAFDEFTYLAVLLWLVVRGGGFLALDRLLLSLHLGGKSSTAKAG